MGTADTVEVRMSQATPVVWMDGKCMMPERQSQDASTSKGKGAVLE